MMRKVRTILTAGIFFFIMNNLQSQVIVVPQSLKDNSEVYKVKGRYGIKFNQEISFGDYYTSKIKKGWTKVKTMSTSGGVILPNTAEYKAASQKLSFEQYYTQDNVADVNCIGELESISYEAIKGLLDIGEDLKNVFSGTIYPRGDSLSWQFFINDPDNISSDETNQGVIIKKGETAIQMYSVSKLEGKKTIGVFETLYGFVFEKDGVPIGAISLHNNGAVTIRNDIADELKLVIASTSTGLLVRQRLDD